MRWYISYGWNDNLGASLIDDSCLDTKSTHPVRGHQSRWPGSNDEDIN
jgi:hypothetical protein